MNKKELCKLYMENKITEHDFEDCFHILTEVDILKNDINEINIDIRKNEKLLTLLEEKVNNLEERANNCIHNILHHNTITPVTEPSVHSNLPPVTDGYSYKNLPPVTDGLFF